MLRQAQPLAAHLQSEHPSLVDAPPLVHAARARQARERQLRAQALTLRQLQAPADEAPLSLHRQPLPLPPVRIPQMHHGLTLRWAAAQVSNTSQVLLCQAPAPAHIKRMHT